MAGKKKAPAPEEAAPKTETPVEATTAPAPEEAAPSKGSITVKFLDHAGVPTERTFSKEVHGPDFAKLADEFKATNAHKLIK